MFHRFHTGTWQRRLSGRVPTRFIPVRVARATVTMAVLRICALLLLFDCQEAFHCCLVVACINRINMISIECHRSGERCPGKREFDNRIEINRVRSGEIMWLFPLRCVSRSQCSLTSLASLKVLDARLLLGGYGGTKRQGQDVRRPPLGWWWCGGVVVRGGRTRGPFDRSHERAVPLALTSRVPSHSR